MEVLIMKMSKKVLLFTIAVLTASNYDLFAMKRRAGGDAYDGGAKVSRTDTGPWAAFMAPFIGLDPVKKMALLTTIKDAFRRTPLHQAWQ
jgi:hypothetical protein